MPDPLWHYAGYTLALAAAILTLRALFADRPKGRKRCRKCWYDLAAHQTLPITCPECGTTHTKPNHLNRTRPRKRYAALALALLLASYALWTTPRVLDRGWYGAVPTTALIVAAPWLQRSILPWPTDHTSATASAQRDAYSRAYYDEMFRVIMDNPICLAEELAIRWSKLGSAGRFLYIQYWRVTGHLVELNAPVELGYSPKQSIPARLTREAFERSLPGIPREAAREIVRGVFLRAQPIVWHNERDRSYELDIGAAIHQISYKLPQHAQVTVTVQFDHLAEYHTTIDVDGYQMSNAPWRGEVKSDLCFPMNSTNQPVVLLFDVSLSSGSAPIKLEIEYEIIPWTFEPELARVSWGTAVPTVINGKPVRPPQEPRRSFLSLLREAEWKRHNR